MAKLSNLELSRENHMYFSRGGLTFLRLGSASASGFLSGKPWVAKSLLFSMIESFYL